MKNLKKKNLREKYLFIGNKVEASFIKSWITSYFQPALTAV